MSAEERARAALSDPNEGEDLPLKYLRLIWLNTPDEFAATVQRINERLGPDQEARARMRARLQTLAGEML